MSKTVPLSVRITEQDATFIAKIKLPGAITPSEKVRVLISQARQRYQSAGDPMEAAAFLRALLEPQREKIRALESETASHSELVAKLGDWLPEFFAHFLSAQLSNSQNPTQTLAELEKGLSARLVSLMESVLRLAVTRRNPCYDPEAISSRLEGVQELVDLISQGKSS